MTVHGFSSETDARDLLTLLRQGPEDSREKAPIKSTRIKPNAAANARWFAKTPEGGIGAFDFGEEFDDAGGSSFSEIVPSAICKLYIVRMNADGDEITIERWLTPAGDHAEVRVGNLLTEAVDGDALVGINRAVGGAFVVDHGSCSDG